MMKDDLLEGRASARPNGYAGSGNDKTPHPTSGVRDRHVPSMHN